ncbi:hypothetical protein ACFX1R_042068 [Malus domestica]|uniref:malate dehydrogenase [NADP], chloroplastic-like isoform X1 n=1 Tax=Malus domestica TaxID=3750 RepID=UPI0039764AF7
MAVAELSTPSYTKTHLFQLSQLSSLSTHLHSHRRVAFRPLPHTRNARICCSVAPNQVQAPAAPAQTEDPKNKPECFGVFCLTYDLQAEEETKSWKKLINIAVSGAAGMISNHLLFKTLRKAETLCTGYDFYDDL